MRSLVAVLLLAAVPSAASAGPALGLRVGYAVSSGNAQQNVSMSDVAKSEIPLQLDLLWRGKNLGIGGYYAFGFGKLSSGISDRCDAIAASCSVWTMRAGVQAQWKFTDLSERYAPWVGGGTGWEWAREKISAGPQAATQHVSGWEMLNLEGGADVKVSPALSVGPYLQLRMTEYKRLDGYSIGNQAFHRWVGLGIRGTWDF